MPPASPRPQPARKRATRSASSAATEALIRNTAVQGGATEAEQRRTVTPPAALKRKQR
jgi:hypothetical protein